MVEPYFIAEIGINHNGDLQITKRLIDAAFACDWQCVKFQKRNPDICVPDDQKDIMRDTPWGRMTYLEYKHRIEFGKKEYDYIDKYCREKSISWSASVWDLDSLDFIQKYDVPFIKIPSAMLTNDELLEAVMATEKNIVLSTGMSSIEEIDHAVMILKNGDSYYRQKDYYHANFTLLHCNSTYPAPEEDLNLNNIKMLKDRYHVPIGYSGHEEDLEASMIAVVLGATIIERHVTLDHSMWGTDQRASLEIIAMDMLKKRCSNVHAMLGSYNRIVTESEKSIRKKLRG